MPILVKQNEATAARRRIYFHCVDATDGITPETGEAGGQPQISKNGGAWTNTTNTLVAIGNGRYYVELTAAEVDTLGIVESRYKSANTAEALGTTLQVVPWDPYDSVRMGISALPNASPASNGGLPTVDANNRIVGIQGTKNVFDDLNDITAASVWAVGTRALTDKADFALSTDGILAIWHQLTASIVTANTIGKLLKDNINATISSRSSHSPADVRQSVCVAGDPADSIGKTLYELYVNRMTATRAGYIDELDFDLDARLGAPVISVSADIADLITRAKGLDEIHDDIETHDTDIKGTGFVADTDSLVDLAHKAGTKGTDNIYDDTNEIQSKLPDDKIAGSSDATSLESKHGSGNWEGTTPVDVAIAVLEELIADHQHVSGSLADFIRDIKEYVDELETNLIPPKAKF